MSDQDGMARTRVAHLSLLLLGQNCGVPRHSERSHHPCRGGTMMLGLSHAQHLLPDSFSSPLSQQTPDRRQVATCIGNLVALALKLIEALEKLFYEFDVKRVQAGTNDGSSNAFIKYNKHNIAISQDDNEERLRSAAVLARVELLQNGLITVDGHIRQLLRDLTYIDDDLARKIELVRERAAGAR